MSQLISERVRLLHAQQNAARAQRWKPPEVWAGQARSGGVGYDDLRGLSEAQVRQKVEPLLEPDFLLDREITGVSLIDGKKYRLDLVLQPKDLDSWGKDRVFFGVEFKRACNFKTIDVGHFTRQAISYHFVEWKQYGRLPVLVCPDLQFYGGASEVKYELARVMSAFGVLELNPARMEINYSSTHTLWTARSGVTKIGRDYTRLGIYRTGH